MIFSAARYRSLLAVGVLGALAAAPAAAHNFTITQVVAVFQDDGTYQIEMLIDVDALALGVSSSTPSEEIVASLRALSPDDLAAAVEKARDTVRRRVRIRFDDHKSDPTISFPQRDAPPVPGVPPTVLGTVARLSGHVPKGARTFTFSASRAFGPVELTIEDAVSDGHVNYAIAAGAGSPRYILYKSQTVSRLTVIGQYLIIGYEHILPKGLDHILFVLGLFLLSVRLRPLLWQISAFTVAHTLSLALSMANVASLPPQIVEPLIALSIAYVAVENLFVREMKPWRPALVFGFGLLHGMGFAGVLRELGMPEGRFVTALVSFNLGVEFGQLTVVAAAILAIGWFRNRTWYRRVLIQPISLGIALVGLYWAIERTFFVG